ncbi:MAG TPA: c-type cytochrome [Gemmatimonadaceae bacterium]|nr:c-type cytochrome [Gemmatimonadaceae bacterium]
MKARSIAWTFLALAFLPGVARGQRAGTSARLARPLTSRAFRAAKARALIRDRLPCLGCHTLDGVGGRLGPPLDSVAGRRSPEYVAAMLEYPDSVVPGSIMPRVPMDELTRDLLVEFLAGRAAARTPAATTRRNREVTAWNREATFLYGRYCAPCHGPNGEGDGPNARFLPVPPARHASSAAMSQRSDDALFDTIYGGGAIMNKSSAMPAYGATLSAIEIRSLVMHIRRLCRCSGPEWSRRYR